MLGPIEVRAGDRVSVSPAADVPDGWLPDPSTPGTVTDVDRDGIEVTIDFATAGVYAVDAGGPLAHAIVHDYCSSDFAPAASVSIPDDSVAVEIDL